MVKGVVRVPESAGGGISRRAIFRVPGALPIPDKGCRRFSPGGSAVAPALCNRYGADGRSCISGRPSVDWQAPPDRVCRASAAGNMCGSCWRPCVADMSHIPLRGAAARGGAATEGTAAERMWEPSRKWNRNRGGVTKRGCNRGEPQQGAATEEAAEWAAEGAGRTAGWEP